MTADVAGAEAIQPHTAMFSGAWSGFIPQPVLMEWVSDSGDVTAPQSKGSSSSLLLRVGGTG